MTPRRSDRILSLINNQSAIPLRMVGQIKMLRISRDKREHLKIKFLTFALVAVSMLGVWAVTSEQETASADPKPAVEFACIIFGVPADECPNGALAVDDSCGVFSTAIPGAPLSKLATYGDYLDLDAIYASGPDLDGDELGELLTGVNAPGSIRLLAVPGGKLNIRCEIDVSEYMLDDAPKRAHVTPFHCGPVFDPQTRGTSRLTSKGMLRINCHVGNFGP